MQLNNAPLLLTVRGFLLVNLGPSRPLLIEMKCELRDFVDWVLIKPWFYSICSVQSCPFVQCWPGIFLLRENLCNVGEAFVATGYRQNFDRFKKKNRRKVMVFRHCTGFFPMQCCLESLGQHCTGFLPVQCCPKSITTILNRIFPCAMLSGTSWATLHKIFTWWNVGPCLTDNLSE